MKSLLNKLYLSSQLEPQELLALLDHMTPELKTELLDLASKKRQEFYGKGVYLRGLIEFTNYCKCQCQYCGINATNTKAQRYRLTESEILECCDMGYRLGYRTFVLQGGEDPYFTDQRLCGIVTQIKHQYPQCAITLSVGERSYDSYKALYEAGADRYLLRHETASRKLYEALHPSMSFDRRRQCLYDLKAIGYQVGAGFMVGLPHQTHEDLVEDLLFLKDLSPHMVGLGPFIPHEDTALKDFPSGSLEMTTTLLALVRLLLPQVLLPATTALGSLHPKGRELGLKAGGNVVMPNLSPISVREKYALYNGKICTGDEAAECRQCIQKRIESAGFSLDLSRGDNINWRRSNVY